MTAEPSVAVELAQLRGEISTALADIKGSLRLLLERSDRTDADVRQLRADMEKEVSELRTELEELKKGRWPLRQIGTLAGVGALVVAAFGLVVR